MLNYVCGSTGLFFSFRQMVNKIGGDDFPEDVDDKVCMSCMYLFFSLLLHEMRILDSYFRHLSSPLGDC